MFTNEFVFLVAEILRITRNLGLHAVAKHGHENYPSKQFFKKCISVKGSERNTEFSNIH